MAAGAPLPVGALVMSSSNQTGVPFSGVVTTGGAPVGMCLTEVEAGVGDKGVANVVVVGGGFFLPEVARFPEAADDNFRANSCSAKRAFSVGFFDLVPVSRAIRRSIEQSDHKTEWRKRGKHTDECDE